MPFINNPDSSRELIIFMISFISLFEIINVTLSDPNVFLWMAASVTDAVSVNPNGINNGLSTFPIKDNPLFSNGSKYLLKNPPICPVLYTWGSDNFALADEPLAKALQSFVLANNNLCGKSFSSLESLTPFDEIFYVTSVLSFILDLRFF